MAVDPGLGAPPSEYLRLVKDASMGLLALADPGPPAPLDEAEIRVLITLLTPLEPAQDEPG